MGKTGVENIEMPMGLDMNRPAAETKTNRKGVSKKIAIPLIFILAVTSYWLATDVFAFLDPFLYAGPSRIIPGFLKNFDKLAEGFWSSMKLLVPAYALALGLGITSGVLIGLFKPLRDHLTPYINAVSAVPVTLLTPFAIHSFATFSGASVFIIFLGAFWPILGTTVAGVVTIDKRYLENAATLEITGVEKMFRVVLPAAAPTILAGCSIALKFSFILLTVSEMFGATSGMGYFVQYYSDFARFDLVIVGFIFMALVLVAIMYLFDLFKNRVLAWTLNS